MDDVMDSVNEDTCDDFAPGGLNISQSDAKNIYF